MIKRSIAPLNCLIIEFIYIFIIITELIYFSEVWIKVSKEKFGLGRIPPTRMMGEGPNVAGDLIVDFWNRKNAVSIIIIVID